MECVHCEAPGFNRAIVPLAADEDLAAFCEDCEHRLYGRVLREPLWQRESGCILCPADGDVALPLVECVIEHGHDREVEFHLDEATPLLCSAHASELHPDVDSPLRSPRTLA